MRRYPALRNLQGGYSSHPRLSSCSAALYCKMLAELKRDRSHTPGFIYLFILPGGTLARSPQIPLERSPRTSASSRVVRDDPDPCSCLMRVPRGLVSRWLGQMVRWLLKQNPKRGRQLTFVCGRSAKKNGPCVTLSLRFSPPCYALSRDFHTLLRKSVLSGTCI
jgi:hypothetical protein